MKYNMATSEEKRRRLVRLLALMHEGMSFVAAEGVVKKELGYVPSSMTSFAKKEGLLASGKNIGEWEFLASDDVIVEKLLAEWSIRKSRIASPEGVIRRQRKSREVVITVDDIALSYPLAMRNSAIKAIEDGLTKKYGRSRPKQTALYKMPWWLELLPPHPSKNTQEAMVLIRLIGAASLGDSDSKEAKMAAEMLKQMGKVAAHNNNMEEEWAKAYDAGRLDQATADQESVKQLHDANIELQQKSRILVQQLDDLKIKFEAESVSARKWRALERVKQMQ